MTETLLPCPFCGGEATVGSMSADGPLGAKYWAECMAVDCPVRPDGRGYDTEAEAIAGWNTRAAADPAARVRP
jgi:hypothetical protein